MFNLKFVSFEGKIIFLPFSFTLLDEYRHDSRGGVNYRFLLWISEGALRP